MINIGAVNSYFIATVVQMIQKVTVFRCICSVFRDSLQEGQDTSQDDMALKLRNILSFHLIRLLFNISHTEHTVPTPGGRHYP